MSMVETDYPFQKKCKTCEASPEVVSGFNMNTLGLTFLNIVRRTGVPH